MLGIDLATPGLVASVLSTSGRPIRKVPALLPMKMYTTTCETFLLKILFSMTHRIIENCYTQKEIKKTYVVEDKLAKY